MIDVTFLGTGDSVPTIKRNHTSVLLTYEGENILVDCGEGTQRQIRKARINPCKITRILLTHYHGDHVLGLPGIIQTMSSSGYNKTLKIYGPKGTKEFVKSLFQTFRFQLNFGIDVEEISGKFIDEKDFQIEAEKMIHGVPCNAYSFSKKGGLRIDKKKLEKSKLPAGPHLQKLKEGKDITYEGKKYRSKDLTFEEPSVKISFVYDTLMNEKIISFVKSSDLLVCGSTFSHELENEAKDKKHLTAKQAGEIAKKSSSKKLILTHISQRHEREMEKLLKEARKEFKDSQLVKDFEIIKVK